MYNGVTLPSRYIHKEGGMTSSSSDARKDKSKKGLEALHITSLTSERIRFAVETSQGGVAKVLWDVCLVGRVFCSPAATSCLECMLFSQGASACCLLRWLTKTGKQQGENVPAFASLLILVSGVLNNDLHQ